MGKKRSERIPACSRRELLRLGTGAAVSSWALRGRGELQQGASTSGEAEDEFRVEDWVASPPPGFSPWAAPGLVTRVESKGDFASIMQPNQLWPRADIAKRLLERALTDLTGASNFVAALGRLIHPGERVAVKVNGIAGQVGYKAAVNFEVIEPLVAGLIQLGVRPERITVYEQYPTHLMGSRVNVDKWQLPQGVQAGTHNNRDHVMPRVRIWKNVPTRYCRFMTDADAVIDMTMMKHHHLCGFTGALKNITHGSVENPEDHHENQARPIAQLYRHPVPLSRVRFHVVDAFKIIYDKGPLDKDPRMRVAHGAVYASTDPVALDTVGWNVIDEERKRRGGMTLEAAGLSPGYLEEAARLGLGVHDWNDIRLRSVTI